MINAETKEQIKQTSRQFLGQLKDEYDCLRKSKFQNFVSAFIEVDFHFLHINDGKSTYDFCSITRVAASTIQKSNNEEIKPYKEYPEEHFSGSTSCTNPTTQIDQEILDTRFDLLVQRYKECGGSPHTYTSIIKIAKSK